MAVCPQCDNPLDQDFGVVSCSQCQAVLFVDVEGHVHFNSGEEAEEPLPPEGLSESVIPENQEFADNWLSNEVAPVDQIERPNPPEHLDQSPVVEATSVAKVALNDFSDVESFANSNSTVGPLTYTVIIEDINTKEVRAELKEALTDKKFQWDASDLIKKIKNGKLILEDLGPVKASVVIHRIRELKVKISWRQNVYG